WQNQPAKVVAGQAANTRQQSSHYTQNDERSHSAFHAPSFFFGQNKTPNDPNEDQQQKHCRHARNAETPKYLGAKQQPGRSPCNPRVEKAPGQKKERHNSSKKQQLIEDADQEIRLIPRKFPFGRPKASRLG